jgi:hypothetical protein
MVTSFGAYSAKGASGGPSSPTRAISSSGYGMVRCCSLIVSTALHGSRCCRKTLWRWRSHPRTRNISLLRQGYSTRDYLYLNGRGASYGGGNYSRDHGAKPGKAGRILVELWQYRSRPASSTLPSQWAGPVDLPIATNQLPRVRKRLSSPSIHKSLSASSVTGNFFTGFRADRRTALDSAGPRPSVRLSSVT